MVLEKFLNVLNILKTPKGSKMGCMKISDDLKGFARIHFQHRFLVNPQNLNFTPNFNDINHFHKGITWIPTLSALSKCFKVRFSSESTYVFAADSWRISAFMAFDWNCIDRLIYLNWSSSASDSVTVLDKLMEILWK